MAWVAAAVAGSQLLGSVISGNAAEDAAQTQADAANRASDLQNAQYQQNRADMQPWRDAGAQTLGQLTQGLQSGGEFNRSFGLADFNADPGYQFRQAEGMRGVEASAAARGGALSGAALKALDRYNQGFASNEYSNAYNRFNNDNTTRFNRLASVAGIGQTATRDVAQMGTQNASAMGELGMQGANARASGYVGGANAVQSGLNSLGNFAMRQGVNGSGSGYSGWDAGGYTGSNDRGTFSTGNAQDWFLRNGSGGD